MALILETKPLPLKKDKSGTIRVAETRIPLDTIITAFHNGESAEEIVESFDVLNPSFILCYLYVVVILAIALALNCLNLILQVNAAALIS